MNKEFWKALMIRVAKTWCQAFAAVAGVDGGYRSFSEISWKFALEAATVAAIICLVWNIGVGLPEVKLSQPKEMTEDEANQAICDNEELQEELALYEPNEEEVSEDE